MLKTARFRKRQDQLKLALDQRKLVNLWKGYVRENLRSQPVVDLHDDYDFHVNLNNRALALKDSILDGLYQPRRPFRFRSEKKSGMSRHLVVLHPADALALEAIGDYLDRVITKAQPTDRAYFSRNKPQPPSADSVDETFDSPVFGYPWWILWPKFQERILQFSQEKEITVVTDVATYYDTIDFSQLRNFVACLGGFSEVFLDFLFFTLERFVWRPDYLPHPGRGMPQINLDCPRLLAHAFLFEADEFLNEKTKGNFVRWLDDIDFGCGSKDEAHKILGDLDELLLSRGLHLNSSKTKILTKEEAFEYFQVRENRYLTILGRRIERQLSGTKYVDPERRMLRRRFREFIDSKNNVGQWAKIIKRYVTLFGKCGDVYLDKWVSGFVYDNPELRPSIFRYFQLTGWSQFRESLLMSYAKKSADDHGLFSALAVLMDWTPPSTVQYVQRLRKFVLNFDKANNQGFLVHLWILGKYGTPDDLDELLSTTVSVWNTNEWLARQVAALFPRYTLAKTQNLVKTVILRFGLTDAQSVLDNFEFISSNDRNTFNKVRNYVVAAKSRGLYPLAKVMVCRMLVSGRFSRRARLLAQNDALSVIRCSRSKQLIKQVVV